MAEQENAGYLYFERQRRQFCLLHALNNLQQGERKFTQRELNRIADNLPSVGGRNTKWWNRFSMVFKPRHRTRWWGNYDANVLEGALATRGKEMTQYDRRYGANGFISTVDTYGDNFVGIILNVPTETSSNAGHWVAVLKINRRWYNLDSTLEGPVHINNLKEYLNWLFSKSGDAFIVFNRTNMVNST